MSSGSLWINSKQLTGPYGLTGSFNTQSHINLENGYFLQGNQSDDTLKEIIGFPAGQNYIRIAGSGNEVHILSDTQISGSLSVRDGITGSLFGTASYADRSFRATEIGDDFYNLEVLDIGFGLSGGGTDTLSLINAASNNLTTITIDNVQNASNSGYASAAGTATIADSVNTLNQTVTVSGSIEISGSLFLNGVAVGSSGTETDPVYTSEKPTLATTGSNQFHGNQVVTGSVDISGSFGLYSYGSLAPVSTPSRPGLLYFTDTSLYISLD